MNRDGFDSISVLHGSRRRSLEGQRYVARTIQNRKDKLDTAIKQCRKIPCLDEDSDTLSFWRGYDVPDSALEQLVQSAA